MSDPREHRLAGLEPDNLLAFLALLGLLRALEEAEPTWRVRAGWRIDEAPLRPYLRVAEAVSLEAVTAAAARGAAMLAAHHDFAGKADLNHSEAEASAALHAARAAGGYSAELFAALMSDGAAKDDKIEATPLCLMFGQGHQHFLSRLDTVPKLAEPPARGKGKKAVAVSSAACMAEALFAAWERPDPTESFRWDVTEDVRYALMASDPTSPGGKREKGGAQHGANRLAAIGLSALPVAPVKVGQRLRANVPGGAFHGRRREFTLTWPIWRDPLSLGGIVALMRHPGLGDADVQQRLGIDHLREARRFSQGKFMNFGMARPSVPDGV
ncbi:MAG: hypothetical protein IT548_05155 [Alphaproteobacteria bacterium]|nr:hypothetical protein [Alphaproteobacteria bacterium]